LARGLGRALDALYAILDEEQANHGRAVARLRYIVRRVVEITLRHLSEVTMLFRVRGNSPTERDALDRRRRFDRIVAEIVATAQSDGDVRADLDAGLITRLAFGMSNSLVEWYRPDGAIDDAAMTHAILAVIFEGLAPR